MNKLSYLLIAVILWSTVLINNLRAEAPEMQLKDQPIENIVTYFAEENGIDPALALKVMQCESGGSQDTVSDGGRSRGIFQYQEPTFERHAKKFGEELDYNSAYDQAKLATWAIANGMGNEWTAYRTIQNGGKYSFYSNQLKKHFTVYCK